MARAAAGTVRVYEVLYDLDCDGPMGDGLAVYRTRDAKAAAKFASENTCYGKPAKADANDVPRRLASRWGMC